MIYGLGSPCRSGVGETHRVADQPTDRWASTPTIQTAFVLADSPVFFALFAERFSPVCHLALIVRRSRRSFRRLRRLALRSRTDPKSTGRRPGLIASPGRVRTRRRAEKTTTGRVIGKDSPPRRALRRFDGFAERRIRARPPRGRRPRWKASAFAARLFAKTFGNKRLRVHRRSSALSRSRPSVRTGSLASRRLNAAKPVWKERPTNEGPSWISHPAGSASRPSPSV